MNKSAKYFILIEVILGILVVIFASLMLKGQGGGPLGRVAVIVCDSDGSQWSAFKYGIRMAAQERGVDAVILGTESVMSLEEQQELIESELENGADAVIVQPVSDEGAGQMLEGVKKKVPVMLVESRVPEETSLPVTEADPYGLGGALAKELLKDFEGSLEGKTLGVLSRTTDSSTADERMKGFQAVMEDEGVEIHWYIAGNFDKGEAEYLASQPKVDIIAALDDSSLTAAGAYASSNGLEGAVLYGIGHSTQAAYYLDKGIVECLVTPDEFSVGYQSMSEIADCLEKLFYSAKDRMVSYTVLRRESLFSQKGQEILFTMSQ